MTTKKWPKILPSLTPEKKEISDAFVKIWHETLPKKYNCIEKFNQGFSVENSSLDFKTTLELGAGLGEHLSYEKLTPDQEKNYYCNELRENMAMAIRQRFPHIKTIVGDCQKPLDFPDGFFDRILAINLLEHLPNLPKAIEEAYRLIHKKTGTFLVVIPTEGSLAYSLARKISAERVYKKHFGADYSWFYQREHINLPHEILEELAPYFTIEKQRFYPLRVPLLFCNLAIGLVLKPRENRSL